MGLIGEGWYIVLVTEDEKLHERVGLALQILVVVDFRQLVAVKPSMNGVKYPSVFLALFDDARGGLRKRTVEHSLDALPLFEDNAFVNAKALCLWANANGNSFCVEFAWTTSKVSNKSI